MSSLCRRRLDCSSDAVCSVCYFTRNDLTQIQRHNYSNLLTLLHTERPKLYSILAFLSAMGLCTCTVKPVLRGHPGEGQKLAA